MGDTRWRSASQPSCFTLREGVPCTHCIGGWVNTRASLKVVAKRKPLPLLRLTLDIQSIANDYTKQITIMMVAVMMTGIS